MRNTTIAFASWRPRIRSSSSQFLKELRRDAQRYAESGGWFAHSGFWIGAIYRFGAWAHSLPSVFLRKPARALYRLARFSIRIIFNVDFLAGSAGMRIGAGLCLIHPSNIIIASEAEIGEDCLIFHEVTIGEGPVPGWPKIGNGVDIYVGARILGGITIGDHSMIGPNCVVVQDVPPNSVLLPPPNLRIPRSLSPVAGLADRKRQAKTANAPDVPLVSPHAK
jgi:serine O-acetyltransferase